jgi:hypothetical protein
MRFDKDYVAVNPGYSISCPYCLSHLEVENVEVCQPDDDGCNRKSDGRSAGASRG